VFSTIGLTLYSDASIWGPSESRKRLDYLFSRFCNHAYKAITVTSRSIFGNIKHEQTVEKNLHVQFSMQTAVS
jgi:hypothetical protein